MGRAEPLSPAARRERRGLVAALGVFGLFWGAWAAVLPAVQRDVGADDGALGLALGAIAVAAVPTMLLAGRLVDRFGARWPLLLSLLAFAATAPLPGTVDSTKGLVVALALLGLTTGALDVVANTAAAAWERLESRPLMPLVHGAFSVGVLVGGAAAGLARELGAEPLQVLLGVGAAVAAAAAAAPSLRRASAGGATGSAPRGRTALLGLAGLVALAFLVEDAMQSWSSVHLERDLGATPAVSGLGPALFAGAMAAGRLGGHLLLSRVREAVLLRASGAAVAVGAVAVATSPAPAGALAGLVVAGAGASLFAPVLYTEVGRRAPAGREGADLGVVSSLGYVGFVAGPPLVGGVSAASSLPIAIALLAVVGTVLAVAAPQAVREQPGRMRQ